LAAQLKHNERTMRNLIDNITAANRDLVDSRLAELRREHTHLEEAITATEQAEMTAKEIDDVVDETAGFVDQLEESLRHGDMDHRQAAVRRCITQMEIQTNLSCAKMCIRRFPTDPCTEYVSEICKLK
jgi:hypothetical protein